MSKKRTSADKDTDPETREVSLRGSREASLGADGLRISKAVSTTPAHAPDDSRPPAYAEHDREEGEEVRYASREAALGGHSVPVRPAGGLPPEDEEALPRGSRPGDPDPERDWAEEEGDKKG